LSGCSEPVFEDVETWCSLKRSQRVVLSLRVDQESKDRAFRVITGSKGTLVSGVAVSCDSELNCPKGQHCLLGKRIMTGRKRK
jgi:hypothetical protein